MLLKLKVFLTIMEYFFQRWAHFALIFLHNEIVLDSLDRIVTLSMTKLICVNFETSFTTEYLLIFVNFLCPRLS